MSFNNPSFHSRAKLVHIPQPFFHCQLTLSSIKRNSLRRTQELLRGARVGVRSADEKVNVSVFVDVLGGSAEKVFWKGMLRIGIMQNHGLVVPVL